MSPNGQRRIVATTANRVGAGLQGLLAVLLFDHSTAMRSHFSYAGPARPVSLKEWLGVLLLSIMAIAVCIRWVDGPVAHVFELHAARLSTLGQSFSSSILVPGEISVIVLLSFSRLVWGPLHPFAHAILLATWTSLITFEANEYILKMIFGRQVPIQFLRLPTVHTFYFFQGDDHNSFPSGHMVMATSLAVVIGRNIPPLKPWLAAGLCLAALLLIIGEWHFVSDTIAGAFVGWTAGLVATSIWKQAVPHGALNRT